MRSLEAGYWHYDIPHSSSDDDADRCKEIGVAVISLDVYTLLRHDDQKIVPRRLSDNSARENQENTGS